jgi:hypothetical protein
MSKPTGKLTVQLAWAILLAGSALFVLWLYVFCPPATEQDPGVSLHAGPYAPPVPPKVLPVSPADAARIAIREIKSRERWVGKKPDEVQRQEDTWVIAIDHPTVRDECRIVTVDGQDASVLKYEKYVKP